MKNYQTESERKQKLEEMNPKYYTRNPGETVVMFEKFENALDAYRNAAFIDGKTLGVAVNGHTMDLAWYDSTKMENILYNAAINPKRYLPEALPETLKELSKTTGRLLSVLKKENALIQLLDAVADVKMRSTLENQSDVQVKGRLVSCCEPQNFFEISVEGKKIVIQVVQENEVVDIKKTWISPYEKVDKESQVVSEVEAAEWMRDKIMDLDFKLPEYGQPAFTYYGTYGWTRLEEHDEILKTAEKTKLLANESGIQFKEIVLKTIQEDIRTAGFKPTKRLVNSVLQFAKLEGKVCTMKELAERKREEPDFKNPEKEKCFRDIIEECQRQEVQCAKMEMLTEQSLTL